jgi:hypothetical protein
MNHNFVQNGIGMVPKQKTLEKENEKIINGTSIVGTMAALLFLGISVVFLRFVDKKINS